MFKSKKLFTNKTSFVWQNVKFKHDGFNNNFIFADENNMVMCSSEGVSITRNWKYTSNDVEILYPAEGNSAYIPRATVINKRNLVYPDESTVVKFGLVDIKEDGTLKCAELSYLPKTSTLSVISESTITPTSTVDYIIGCIVDEEEGIGAVYRSGSSIIANFLSKDSGTITTKSISGVTRTTKGVIIGGFLYFVGSSDVGATTMYRVSYSSQNGLSIFPRDISSVCPYPLGGKQTALTYPKGICGFDDEDSINWICFTIRGSDDSYKAVFFRDNTSYAFLEDVGRYGYFVGAYQGTVFYVKADDNTKGTLIASKIVGVSLEEKIRKEIKYHYNIECDQNGSSRYVGGANWWNGDGILLIDSLYATNME